MLQLAPFERVDGETFEQVTFPFKKSFQRTDSKAFAKPSGTAQKVIFAAADKFMDKFCFVDV